LDSCEQSRCATQALSISFVWCVERDESPYLPAKYEFVFRVREDKGAGFVIDKDSSSCRGIEPQSLTLTFTVLKADDDGAASVVMIIYLVLLRVEERKVELEEKLESPKR